MLPTLEVGSGISSLEIAPSNPQRIHVDIDVATLHAPVREALTQLATENPGAISEYIIPIDRRLIPRLSQVYGKSLGGVPLTFLDSHGFQFMPKEKLGILSFEPYTLFHTAKLLGGAKIGFLKNEVLSTFGSIPARMTDFVINTSRQEVAP